MELTIFCKFEDGEKTIQRIKKNNLALWFHFRRSHWGLEMHPNEVANKVAKSNFKDFKTIKIKLSKDNLNYYWNSIDSRFEFNGDILERGKQVC